MTTYSDSRCRALEHDLVDARAAASLEAIREWIGRPSFSDTGEGIEQCAAFTRDLLRRVAPDARTVRTAGHPIVTGTVAAASPDAPTLLVYGLYDVTPTIAEEWTVDPLAAPVLDGAEIGLAPSPGPVLVGRGAVNHKGPVLASVLAVQALLDAGRRPPVNLWFVIEGEEEIGSPSLGAFVADNARRMRDVDGVWLPCMQQNSAGMMTLRESFKGSLWVELECTGGRAGAGGTRDGRHVWAGNSAWIDAPMMRLVKALGTLYDDEQRCTIDGLDQELPAPSAADRAVAAQLADQFDAHPEWERRMLDTLNVERSIGGRPLSAHLWHYMFGTSINVQGIDGGYRGPSFYTMMPGSATAKLDVRFPPGVAPERVAALIDRHLDARGFSDVRCRGARGYEGAPAQPGPDTLIAAARDTAAAYGVPVSEWPMANNCCPAAILTVLPGRVPFSIAGLGYGDRAHAPDEFITVDSVPLLMHFTIDYLDSWAARMQPGNEQDDRGRTGRAPAAHITGQPTAR